jgi:hypothetical protein
MVIFHSYVSLPEGKCPILGLLNITWTSICWRLFPQYLGDVKNQDIYQPLNNDMPSVLLLDITDITPKSGFVKIEDQRFIFFGAGIFFQTHPYSWWNNVGFTQ